MTMLCYTTQEAADAIGLSEPVLVRLSHALKVPQRCYTSQGLVSLDTDLNFTSEDLNFFSDVKNRLLAGETIDQVKARLVKAKGSGQTVPIISQTVQASHRQATGFDAHLDADTIEMLQQPSDRLKAVGLHIAPNNPTAPRLGKGLQTLQSIQNNHLMAEAAEANLTRYKKRHGLGQKPVFQSLLKAASGVFSKPRQATPSAESINPDLSPTAARPPLSTSMPITAAPREQKTLPDLASEEFEVQHWTEIQVELPRDDISLPLEAPPAVIQHAPADPFDTHTQPVIPKQRPLHAELRKPHTTAPIILSPWSHLLEPSMTTAPRAQDSQLLQAARLLREKATTPTR